MKSLPKEMLPYQVGGLLYTPAVNESIADKILTGEYSCLTSAAICLEDAIMEGAVEEAEEAVVRTFRKLYEQAEDRAHLPLLFVRVRNPEHLERVCRKLAPYSEIQTGYILPKFDTSNARDYLRAMELARFRAGRMLYAMPILESRRIADCSTRMQELTALRSMLLEEKQSILNVRVGGNDFCQLYGIRRSSRQTIYDAGVVRDILIDIVNIFAPDFVVSAPVWEYFGTDSGEAWAQGLKRELTLDRINGFIGKTAVHPTQLPVIYDSLRVSADDYQDALSILDWQDDSYGVSKSLNGSRMNEVKCHERWAAKIKILGDIYGIKED